MMKTKGVNVALTIWNGMLGDKFQRHNRVPIHSGKFFFTTSASFHDTLIDITHKEQYIMLTNMRH